MNIVYYEANFFIMVIIEQLRNVNAAYKLQEQPKPSHTKPNASA